jgi:hypothetical protein
MGIAVPAEAKRAVRVVQLSQRAERRVLKESSAGSVQKKRDLSIKEELLTAAASLAVITAGVVGIIGSGSSKVQDVPAAISNLVTPTLITPLQQGLARIYAHAGVDTVVDKDARRFLLLKYLYSDSPYVPMYMQAIYARKYPHKIYKRLTWQEEGALSDAEWAEREDAVRKLLTLCEPGILEGMYDVLVKHGIYTMRAAELERVPAKSDLWDKNALKDINRSTYLKQTWYAKNLDKIILKRYGPAEKPGIGLCRLFAVLPPYITSDQIINWHNILVTMHRAQGNKGIEFWSDTGKAYWLSAEPMCRVLSFLGRYNTMQAARYGELAIQATFDMSNQEALALFLAS